MRAEVNSPTYLAGAVTSGDIALVNPATLAWGLARAAEDAGVRISSSTPVDRHRRAGPGWRCDPATRRSAARGRAGHERVPPAWCGRVRLHTVPVYDYVLVTEPLSASQLDRIGWRNRQGIGDAPTSSTTTG